MTLSVLALQNAPILRAIAEAAEPLTVPGLSQALERDPSNLRKSLQKLAEEGLLLDPPLSGLTDAGRAQLAALDRADAEPGSSPAAGDLPQGLLSLRHDQILPDPDNARADWDSEEARWELDALRMDIVQNGLLQNLVVRPIAADDLQDAFIEVTTPTGDEILPRYRLVAGERRWRAVGAAIKDGDWDADRPILARLLNADAKETRFAAIAENLLRRKLNPIEKARGFEQLAELGFENRLIADRLGYTPEHVQQHRRFLKLDEADQQRMTLPRDDPRHMSVRDARQKLADQDKPKVPPPTLDVDPAVALVLQELVHAAHTRGAYTYDDIEVTPAAADDAHLSELVGRNWAQRPELRDYGKLRGRWVTRLGYTIPWAAIPSPLRRSGEDAAEGRDRALTEIQRAFAAVAGTDLPPLDPDRPYVTRWLAGPFAITTEGQAIIDQAVAEERELAARHEREAAEREAARQRQAEIAERARVLFAAHRSAPPPAEALTETARAAEAPLPWRIDHNGHVVDAEGAAVIHGRTGDRGEARMRLVVLAVNAAAGLETPEDLPAPEPDAQPAALDAEAFQARMAVEVRARNPELDEDQSEQTATDILNQFLDDNGVDFGDEGFAWDPQAAVTLVDEWFDLEGDVDDGDAG